MPSAGYLNGAEDYFEHTRADSGFAGLDFRNGSAPNTLASPVRDRSCNATSCYSAHVFAAEAARIISAHDPAVPFFLYLPFQSVHAPLRLGPQQCHKQVLRRHWWSQHPRFLDLL